MYVLTLNQQDIEALKKYKPEITDIIDKLSYAGTRQSRLYSFGNDIAKEISLIARNKHTTTVWNSLHEELKHKLIRLHAHYSRSLKRKNGWFAYVKNKHHLKVNEFLEVLNDS